MSRVVTRRGSALSRRFIDDIYADCSQIDLQMVAWGHNSHFEVGTAVVWFWYSSFISRHSLYLCLRPCK